VIGLRVRSDVRGMLLELERQSKSVAPKAIRKAANETLKRLHESAAAQIQASTGLPKKVVTKRLKRYRATARGRAARIWWGGYQIPLSQISKRQRYQAGTARAGKVTVSARGLFKATVRAGNTSKHTGPFVRKPEAATASGHVRRRRKRPGGRYSVGIISRKGRLPIREVKFDSARVAEPAFRRLERTADVYFSAEIAKALAAQL
jgi:hypothetical protein